MQTPQTPIPLTILTGFLGAGKTTLLNTILNGDHGLRIAVLVNDFGKINIDSQLVVDVDADDTIELSNGCICCTIRGDLLKAMIDVTRRPQPPEYIIIEASGVSDPLEISLTFRRPELASHVAIDAVLTVIDAEQILTLEKQSEALAVLQVGAADIVILNKVDLVDDAGKARVKKWVRSIIPNARILEAVQGKVPLDLILGIGQFSPDRLTERMSSDVHVHEVGDLIHHHHHDDHSLVFSTYSWTDDRPLSLRALRRVIENLPETIFRAKGIVYLADDPEHAGILQVVGKRASVTWGQAWNIKTPHSEIVVIGEHGTVDAQALDAAFTKCLAEHAPQSEIGHLTASVVEWLRNRFS